MEEGSSRCQEVVDPRNYLEDLDLYHSPLPQPPRITINQLQWISKYLLSVFYQTLQSKEVYSLVFPIKAFVVWLEKASRADGTERATEGLYLVWTVSTGGVQRRGRLVGARRER